jgi:hypothetical protein
MAYRGNLAHSAKYQVYQTMGGKLPSCFCWNSHVHIMAPNANDTSIFKKHTTFQINLKLGAPSSYVSTYSPLPSEKYGDFSTHKVVPS